MPTVLIVAASPLDQDRLRLSAEVRDIRQALQRSRNRESWTIESNEAATVDISGERFWISSLSTHSGPSLHGYVRRHSPEYTQIVDEILSDGNSHSITLKIANTGTPETCRILGLLSPTWIYSEPQSDE